MDAVADSIWELPDRLAMRLRCIGRLMWLRSHTKETDTHHEKLQPRVFRAKHCVGTFVRPQLLIKRFRHSPIPTLQ